MTLIHNPVITFDSYNSRVNSECVLQAATNVNKAHDAAQRNITRKRNRRFARERERTNGSDARSRGSIHESVFALHRLISKNVGRLLGCNP